MTKKRIWLTQEQKLSIVTRYTAGESPDSIAESLGVCSNNIRNALTKAGVKMRDRSEARTRLDHKRDAFDVVTDESGYWIGFIFADGSVYNTGVGSTILDVGLAARDREQLENLRGYIGSSHTIKESINTDVILGRHVQGTYKKVRFSIRSKELTGALIRHGMQNKSLSRVATPELANSRDFWRGVIDGDGYLGVSGNKARLGICGGKELMQQGLSFLQRNGIAPDAHVCSEMQINEVLFKVEISAGSAEKAISLLYKDATYALKRKAYIAEAIIAGDLVEAKRRSEKEDL